MQASGHMTYNPKHFKLSMLMLKFLHHTRLVGGQVLTSVGDCLEDTTLHTIVYKFQSERGVHMHPTAYRPALQHVNGTNCSSLP